MTGSSVCVGKSTDRCCSVGSTGLIHVWLISWLTLLSFLKWRDVCTRGRCGLHGTRRLITSDRYRRYQLLTWVSAENWNINYNGVKRFSFICGLWKTAAANPQTTISQIMKLNAGNLHMLSVGDVWLTCTGWFHLSQVKTAETHIVLTDPRQRLKDFVHLTIKLSLPAWYEEKHQRN